MKTGRVSAISATEKSSLDARAIVQRILDLTEHALLHGQSEEFVRHFRAPHITSGFDVYHVCETEEDLHKLFARASAYYRRLAVTSLGRVCHCAEFRSPTRVVGAYQSRLMSGGNLLHRAPYDCMSELECIDGVWQVRRSNYAIEPGDDQIKVLLHGYQADDA